jgi:hypothetical protein
VNILNNDLFIFPAPELPPGVEARRRNIPGICDTGAAGTRQSVKRSFVFGGCVAPAGRNAAS